MRECVAAFVVEGNNVLLGKRSATREFYPGVWDVFGGHCHPNETREDALRRELHEELGIMPTEWKFLLTVDEPDAVTNDAGKYHFYLVTHWDDAPRNLQPEEHAFIEWFSFEEAMNLPFPHPLYAETLAQIAREAEDIRSKSV